MEDPPPPYSAAPQSPQSPPFDPKGDLTKQGRVQESQQQHVIVPAPVHLRTAPTQVVVVQQQGSCPICKMGYVREEFTLCGVCLAIIFFPLGLICFFLMRVKRCSHCRAIAT